MRRLLSIKNPSDFKKTYKNGKRLVSRRFALYFAANYLPESRLGVSFAKSHIRLSTRRNRLRRIAKEVFRQNKSTLPHGYDFVVASRTGDPRPDMNKITAELKELIARLKTQGSS